MAIESVKLNLKQSAYSTAISQLESKLSELENARSEYETQRQAIPNFWSGDAADEAYETIGQNIEQVKTAYKAVSENIEAFKNAQEEGTSLDTATQKTLEDAKKAVTSLFTT